MTGPRFSAQISLGNVLQIGAMLVMISVGYATLSGEIKAATELAHENRRTIQQHQTAISSMQRTEARTDARLQSIDAGMARIESSVNDLVRYLREEQRAR